MRRHAPLPPLAVPLDRDGTPVQDVPYNGDPALVRPLPTARAALDRLRAAGAPVVVPTPVTRPEEVAAAPEVCGDLLEAVELLLVGRSAAAAAQAAPPGAR